MTEPPADRWFTRDLPFLRYVVPKLDDNPRRRIGLDEIRDATGLDDKQVRAAAQALAEGGYVETRFAGGMRAGWIWSISERARQTVGVWPNDNIAADRLIAAISAMAERTDIPELERSRWATVLNTLGGASRDFVVQVAAAMLSGQLPH